MTTQNFTVSLAVFSAVEPMFFTAVASFPTAVYNVVSFVPAGHCNNT